MAQWRVMKRKKRRKMISTTDRSVRAWASRGTLEGVEEAEEDLAVTGTEEDEGVGAEVASEGDAVASAVTVKDPEAAAVASGVTVTGSDGDVVALAVTVMGSEGDAVVLATAGALVVMMMSMVQMVGTTKDSREMERVASGEDEAEALATAGASEIAMVIPMDSITEMSVEEDNPVRVLCILINPTPSRYGVVPEAEGAMGVPLQTSPHLPPSRDLQHPRSDGSSPRGRAEKCQTPFGNARTEGISRDWFFP